MTTNWNKDKPAGSDKIRLSDDMLRANFAALEDALGRDHNFPGNEGTDAGRHKVIQLIDQGADQDEPSAGIIKIWNNGDAFKIRVPGGAARYLDAIPSGEIVLFEKDTAVAGYTLKTDVDDRLCFISKGSAAGGQTGGTNHSSGTWTQPDHVHTGPSHTHTGPSHTHSMEDHTHSMQGHTHTGPSHTHSMQDHKHETPVAPWTAAVAVIDEGEWPHGLGDTTRQATAISRTATQDKKMYLSGPPSTANTGSGGTGNTGGPSTANTGTPSTANTGAGGTGDTGASGTGDTGGSATENTWRPAARVFTRQQRN
jgi:hypothetical protein